MPQAPEARSREAGPSTDHSLKQLERYAFLSDSNSYKIPRNKVFLSKNALFKPLNRPKNLPEQRFLYELLFINFAKRI